LQSGERLVIDASVAVKRVIREPDSERAEFLLDHGLVAPDLLVAECANDLWKKVRRRELTKEEAEIAAQTLEQADLTVESTSERLALATSIAVEFDHPAYDAVYLAVAEASNLRLATADDRLVRKVREAHSRLRDVVAALSEVARQPCREVAGSAAWKGSIEVCRAR
jgi:predicted nucleic acid-binding protein